MHLRLFGTVRTIVLSLVLDYQDLAIKNIRLLH